MNEKRAIQTNLTEQNVKLMSRQSFLTHWAHLTIPYFPCYTLDITQTIYCFDGSDFVKWDTSLNLFGAYFVHNFHEYCLHYKALSQLWNKHCGRVSNTVKVYLHASNSAFKSIIRVIPETFYHKCLIFVKTSKILGMKQMSADSSAPALRFPPCYA